MNILATRLAVSLVLWSLSVSITSACSTSCILACDLGLAARRARRRAMKAGDVVVGVVAAVARRPAGSGCARDAGRRGQFFLGAEDRGGLVARAWCELGHRRGADRVAQRRRCRAAAARPRPPPVDCRTVNAPAADRHASLPLARLLDHTADAVQAVRAGRSLTDALARCPAAARPGAQALSLPRAALARQRRRRCARGSRRRRRRRRSTRCCSTALALLWPAGAPPYAEHTLVDQAVDAARKRAPASGRLRQRRAAPLPARARGAGRAALAATRWRAGTTRAGGSSACSATGPTHWQAAAARPTTSPPPMTLRVNARRGDAAGLPAAPGRAGHRRRTAGRRARPWCWPQPCPVHAAARLRRGRRVGAGRRRAAAPRRCCSAGAGLAAPARACSTPAPRPAARPRTCWSWPTSTCWRSTATRAPGARARHAAPAGPAGAHCVAADAARPGRLVGRPAVRRHPARRARAPPRASCAATPTCAGCAAPSDVAALARIQAQLLDALWPLLAPGRAAAVLHLLGVQGRGPGTRSTLFCNATATPPSPPSPRRRATCCRCPTMSRASAARFRCIGATASSTPCSTRPDALTDPVPARHARRPSTARRAVRPRGAGVAGWLACCWLLAGAGWRRAQAHAERRRADDLRACTRSDDGAAARASPSTSSCRAASRTRCTRACRCTSWPRPRCSATAGTGATSASPAPRASGAWPTSR